jgi:hypothetical protein
MWTAILLFGIMLPILILGTCATFLWSAIVLVRRRSLDIRVSFSTAVVAYFALMMLIGVFLTASGVGEIGKVALVQVTNDDFGYNPRTTYTSFDTPRAAVPLASSELHDKKNEDVTLGAVLTTVGLLMFGPHALGFASLRRRGAAGAGLAFRGFSLLALAIATIGFLSAAGTALTETLQRVSDGSSGWQGHAIAEPLAFAIVLLSLGTWFGYQLWSLVAADTASSSPAATDSPAPR